MEITSVSQANDMFRKMLDLKSSRRVMSEGINNLQESLIRFTHKNGPVLVYKEDKAVMIETVKKYTKKLNKDAIAAQIHVSTSDLTPIGIAKLVEDGKLTAELIEKNEYTEESFRLKQRKPKKDEILAFQNRK
ncbi:hypothetical protein J9303_00335 [Bacillaceae bacterium Marseille-Q3522]|nr:hypothetical protein [Bacillaceae bacterium Marseille-Q3522]